MVEIIASIRKYNFWDGNPIDLGYARTFYTDKIRQYIGNKGCDCNIMYYFISLCH